MVKLNYIREVIRSSGGVVPFACRILGIDRLWSDEKYIRFRYMLRQKSELNLDHPQRFSEKMQWLKLNNRKDIYTTMVDKYAVRDYVAQRIGEKYIIPLIGVWNKAEEIDFDQLPDKFVLKTTHDSGGIVICTDKKKLDRQQARAKLRKSLKRNYYLQGREWNYKNVPPRIVAEAYLENDSREGLHDYKVWCFNGRAEYVQYITGRIADVTYEGFYDRDWVLQDFSYHNPRMEKPIPRPEQLEELLALSEKLAEGLPFGRIDFYILPDGAVKFGEITFFPMGGTERWRPDEMDIKLGKMLRIDTDLMK